jgi:DNA-binding GntR family transcriptional regulator
MAVPVGMRQTSPVRRSTGIAPIAYRTIAEQIAGSIREAIAKGSILPAARLLEAPLAREMGTSRAPVREALSQLEREGWVVKEPNRGARVLELTEETIREVASLRGVLEGFAASLAVDRLTAKEFKALEEDIAEMDRAAHRGQFPRLIELDYQFHAFICQASGHRILYDTWSGMAGKIRLFLSATNLMYQDLSRIVRGHRLILEALKSRDKARACRIMGEHLGEMLDPFIARLVSSRARAHRGRSRSLQVRAGRGG